MTNESLVMESNETVNQEMLGVKDVARLLKLFSMLWFREGRAWKAIRARAAAAGLRAGEKFIKVDPVPIQSSENLEDTTQEASFARSIFDDVAEIDLPPVFKGITDEMVQDANKLISKYVMK